MRIIMAAALVIGINYEGQDCALQGCLNDAYNVSKFLRPLGYDITLLTDRTVIKPIKQNILLALNRLVDSPYQRLFFSYSGHGSYVRDVNGDETDGRDECLVPLDCDRVGYITDDVLRLIVQRLRPDQRLFCLFDSCHSGTALDLTYNIRRGLFNRSPDGWTMNKDRSLPPTAGQVVLLSGCKDNQYSTDAYINGQNQGALTASFLTSLATKNLTYRSLLQRIDQKLKEGNYSQTPMLSSGQLISLSDSFSL